MSKSQSEVSLHPCSEHERERRFLKVGWHVLLVAAAVIEMRTAKTSFRRCLIGACAGWHVGAAIDDMVSE